MTLKQRLRCNRSLLRNRDGATVVEFGLLAPTLLIMLLGMFEMGYNYYMQSLLQGTIQKAARDSTIEGSTSIQSEIDANVEEAVRKIVADANVTFERASYSSFRNVRQPEEFIDANSDGICNDGETFIDVNNNGMWDEDQGSVGQGGARDATLYKVNVSYPRAFGIHRLIGLSDTVTTSASTVLRNQPYDSQNSTATEETCA